MAYTYSVNNTPTTGAIAMWTLISTMVTAGWLVKMDSDGTTYSSTGGQVTGGGTGAHGLGNNSAWVRLQSPAVNAQTREITIQRGTTDLVWRIKYSANAGFTTANASIGATSTPEATDEVIMAGSGTSDSVSPGFTSLFGANGGYRWHVACGGSAEFYSFIAWAVTSSTTTVTNGIALDVMAAGSFPSSDVDPAVMYVTQSGFTSELFLSSGGATNVTGPAKARAWLGATSLAQVLTTGTNSQNIIMCSYGNALVGPVTVTIGTNPFTGKDDMLPALWVRASSNTSPVGVKGFSTLYLIGSVARTNMDTADTVTTGSKDKIFVGGMWLPWSGAAPTI